jgi:DNA-binding response OmpR family regulator
LLPLFVSGGYEMISMHKMPDIANTSVVLIVDDVPDNLALLTDTLNSRGYVVFSVRSGQAALESMNQYKPDLVLMDVMMPGMDGFETCRKIKQREEFQDIPILFMTGLTESEHILEGFDVGGMDYITKPINIEEVLARVSAHLRILERIRGVHGTASGLMDELSSRKRLVAQFDVTEREAEVLYWVACGKTNRSIGEILGISPRTVNKHLEHAFIKLGVETRTSAASVVIQAKQTSSS